MKHYYKKLCSVALLFILLGLTSKTVTAQVLINEGFTTILPSGWAQQNLSSPAGTGLWFQGNPAVFPAFSGATNAYAACNFQSTTGAGEISNWLFTPQVALANGNVFSFYTRTTTGDFPDRLELRMSTNGASVNVGATNTSVGDYTTLLQSVNPGLTNVDYPIVWTKYTVTISGLAAPTNGRFAFRYFVTDGGPAGNNSDYIGVDDVQYGVPCAGTPTPGNTVSTVATTCPTVPFTLSLQNPASGVGITYQWQSSATGVTGSFTNITGATNATLTTSLTASTYYQAIVSCGASSATSTPVQVVALTCYCTAGATSTAFEKISRVVFGTINNPSTSTAGYQDFTSLTTLGYIGATMPITVTLSGGFAADQVKVWIDFNADFDFDDAGELVYTSPNGAGPHTGNIIIPSTATPGTTRMRVRMHDTSLGPNGTPCGTSTYGQVEDYNVNLVPCIAVTVTTQPANASVSCGGNTSFTVALAGSAPTVYWQYKTSAASTNWLDVPNLAPYSGITTTTLSITGATAAIDGYQYRGVYRGACTGASFSNAATLTVTPLVPVVNPASATICFGSIQQLSLTNTVAGAVTATFAATGLPVAIPDGTFPVGTSTAIPFTVSGIPAGSVVQNIGVRFSITHPYVGDLVMNLKAPNNQKLNLFALLDNATGGNATANFTNTTIDSLSTAAISGAPAPRSGSYRAERYAIGNANFGDLVTPNTTWSALLGTLNGTWNINIADLGAGDAGSVTAASISITYSAPNFAQGTWTTTRPGTIFTDASATVPYTGTPATTVYVKPDTLGITNYRVSFSTPSCQSAIATVPVTVRSLPTTFSVPVNRVICQGATTTFTAAPTNGNASSVVWQISTDNGATFTNLANGGGYTGATTNTLTITAAGVALNGNRYRLSASAVPCTSTANSAVATLTVNPTPVIVLTLNSLTAIYPGQTTTLSAAVSPNPAATFTWFRNGTVVAGANASTLVVDVDKLGLYTANVVDVNGCTATSAAVRISASANDLLFIYPSPNTGQFQVRFFSQLGSSPFPRTVSVFDSKGTRVYSRSYAVTSAYTRLDVDLKNQAKGIYSVELTDSRGNRLKTGRVLVL